MRHAVGLLVSICSTAIVLGHAPAREVRAPAPLTLAEQGALKPKTSFKECDECPEMVVVPAGTFMMGPPEDEWGRFDDERRSKVTIVRPFAVGKFEVTFAEWDACVATGGCRHNPDDADWGRG